MTMMAATETYREHENLIYKIVHNFRKKYGGDFEELLGEARLIYWELYSEQGRRYIKSKKEYTFTGSICFFIQRMLLDLRRKQLYRASHSKETAVDPETFNSRSKNDSRFLVELFDEISSDAVTIIQLCLDNNGYVMRDEAEVKDLQTISTKEFLLRYLRNIGWSFVRIDECFEEIKEALNA